MSMLTYGDCTCMFAQWPTGVAVQLQKLQTLTSHASYKACASWKAQLLLLLLQKQGDGKGLAGFSRLVA